MSEKKLDTTNMDEIPEGTKIHGDPGAWKCICKASNEKEGWMKSTKAMDIIGAGCLVQVTTQQGDNIAEAVTFVPDVFVHETGIPDKGIQYDLRAFPVG